MTASGEPWDAVVIGGGFYGVAVALYLVRRRGLARVLLVEREAGLLRRASFNNQARIHNGYHYPRSFTTAYRSRVNMPRFLHDWPQATVRDFTMVYAIARRNSKTGAHQFLRFCRDIGAVVEPAAAAVAALFEPRLIEGVFNVEEHAFDAAKLAEWAVHALAEAGVEVRTGVSAASVARAGPALSRVGLVDGAGRSQAVCAGYVLNCTYAALNRLGGDFPGTRTALKHEVAEMALVRVPEALRGLGVTVMDGPFFSVMPFPARGLHTLSHVRYTPHVSWIDSAATDPTWRLGEFASVSRGERMLRDAARYLPVLGRAVQVDSLFEVKTVLAKNEQDDGRPILFEKHAGLDGCFSILGGKIDNIYDIFDKLDGEVFTPASSHPTGGKS